MLSFVLLTVYYYFRAISDGKIYHINSYLKLYSNTALQRNKQTTL